MPDPRPDRVEVVVQHGRVLVDAEPCALRRVGTREAYFARRDAGLRGAVPVEDDHVREHPVDEVLGRAGQQRPTRRENEQ